MNQVRPSRWLRVRRRMLRPLALTLPRGARLFPTGIPLATARERCPNGVPRTLLLVLPGIDDLPGDFAGHGLAEAAWNAGLAADVLEVDLHLGYYLRESMTERLHEDVVRAARAQGYERILLAGISLGGLGALLYARAYPRYVDGVVVLAPFLGHDRFIAALQRAGGARDLQVPSGPDFQHLLWSWLASHETRPPIYLGFGDRDRFAPAHRLMAELLPRGSVCVTRGGHDWPTWSHLWQAILAQLMAQPRHWA